MKIEVYRLGLASYISMKEKLIKFENRTFTFESDKTLEEWELEYANSCCARHDMALCGLRRLYKTQK